MTRHLATANTAAKRPFFTSEDFERICQDALQQEHLLPSEPAPVRIDRFVEKRFKIQPSYEDLPDGVLGFTLFGPKGVEEIVVSKSLDEAGTRVAERRLRTTLAHESGHGLLHAPLFVPSVRSDLLFEDPIIGRTSKILCRHGAISRSEASPTRRSPSPWWEYQANRAMGALLLPKSLVQNVLASSLVHRGVFATPVLPANRREATIRLLANTFEVNPVVAELRLEALFPAVAFRQLTL